MNEWKESEESFTEQGQTWRFTTELYNYIECFKMQRIGMFFKDTSNRNMLGIAWNKQGSITNVLYIFEGRGWGCMLWRMIGSWVEELGWTWNKGSRKLKQICFGGMKKLSMLLSSHPSQLTVRIRGYCSESVSNVSIAFNNNTSWYRSCKS